MILVTGGTGFLGSYLLLQLTANEASIRAIYRNESGILKTKALFDLYQKTALFDTIEWLLADILDVPSLENAFAGVEYVYHCAGFISFDPKDEEKLRKINIEGTANVVNFCISNFVKKLCFISSIVALGDPLEHEKIITEKTEWNPEKAHSDYAISKYGAEMEVWRGQQEGLNVIILNPGVILGKIPTEWNSENGSSAFFAKVKNGLRYYTLGSTGFVAVDDVVKTSLLVMKSTLINQRFIIVSENLTYQKLLNTIAEALATKRPTVHLNPFWIKIIARIDWLLSAVFRTNRKLTLSTATASYTKDSYDNSKIKTAINFEFLALKKCISDICK
jgi:dihydroflavonol-4-reductase